MNVKDVYSVLLAGNADDARLLGCWLDERASEREIAREPLPDEILNARQDNKALESAAGVYDVDVAPGQIRILSKRFTLDPDVIPYVAVIEEWDKGIWLAVPFSPYSYPATPGEMATGRRHLGLRVLQSWNARTVPAQLLEKSFLFGDLDVHTCKNAADLFRNYFSGKALPDTFDALTGPAIVYDADPRRDYLVESVVRLRPLSTAVKATIRLLAEDERSGDEEVPFDWAAVRERFVAKPGWGEPEHEYALAAGNTTDTTDTFVIMKDELAVEYAPEDKKARMTVYDQDDRPNADYDGYGVLGKDDEFLGVFRNGRLTVGAESVKGGFQLVDPDGEAVVLVRKN